MDYHAELVSQQPVNPPTVETFDDIEDALQRKFELEATSPNAWAEVRIVAEVDGLRVTVSSDEAPLMDDDGCVVERLDEIVETLK